MDQFVIGFKTQKSWGTLAAVDFFLGGTGAGTFILSMLFGIPAGMIIGWIGVALGAVALLIDLGRPDRFWRAGSQVAHSWISRGVIFTSLFLLFGILRIIGQTVGALGTDTLVGQTVGVLAVLGALGVMLYTGFLLSQSPSIPFWNTTMLPVLFGLSSFTGGIGTVMVLVPALGEPSIDLRTAAVTCMSLTAASLALLWVYLLGMSSATVAARESVRMLTSGGQARSFLVGVTLVGLVIPLVLAVIAYLAGTGSGASPSVLATAGVLVLVGGYFFRYSVLKVGVYAPIMDI